MQRLTTPEQAADWLRAHVRGTLASDSRRLAAGDGFIAWPGQVVDARRFVPAALAAGAAACLVEADGAEAFDWGDDARIAAMPGLKAATGERTWESSKCTPINWNRSSSSSRRSTSASSVV